MRKILVLSQPKTWILTESKKADSEIVKQWNKKYADKNKSNKDEVSKKSKREQQKYL